VRAVLEGGCYYDAERGDHAAALFEQHLRHVKGRFAGQPFRLEPWQRDGLILPLFGWRRANGTRRFRIAYIEIPKKNGKSALCSGIALYLLVGDGEPGAEVYSAAADRNQAGIVYDVSEAMVRASALSQHLRCMPSVKRIIHEPSRSYYQCLSAEAPTKEGLNLHGLIFDELHAQPSRKLWDTLRYGGAAREQPMIVSITTAGYDRDSICWEQHEYARRVLDGTSPDWAFFALIYAAEEDDDWTDPATWRKANPNLGVTVSEDDMRQMCQEAQASPAKQNAFRRYRLNQWTEQDVRWLDMDHWAACARAEDNIGAALTRETVDVCPDDCLAGVVTQHPDPRWGELRGRVCYGGLDLASTQDLTAFALTFPAHDDGAPVPALVWYWLPEDGMARRVERDGIQYDRWADAGWLRLTPGNVVDQDAIVEDIRDICLAFNPREVGYDPWNAQRVASRLVEEEVEAVEVRQGIASLGEACKELDRLVAGRRLRPGANPVTEWCARNVVVKVDSNGNYKPDKKQSRERIDGIAAIVDALARQILHRDERSVYEDGDLLIL
jgi:phage terminase large subunit-like protein